jgi:hypothetical protein
MRPTASCAVTEQEAIRDEEQRSKRSRGGVVLVWQRLEGAQHAKGCEVGKRLRGLVP